MIFTTEMNQHWTAEFHYFPVIHVKLLSNNLYCIMRYI